MFTEITNLDDFNKEVENQIASLFYFSHDECNVCKVLKPKIEQLIIENYNQMKLYYIDTKQFPEIAAQNSIFTNPTVLIYFDKKEFYRKSRNIGIEELFFLIERPYNLMF